jgi:hypothetical protein
MSRRVRNLAVEHRRRKEALSTLSDAGNVVTVGKREYAGVRADARGREVAGCRRPCRGLNRACRFDSWEMHSLAGMVQPHDRVRSPGSGAVDLLFR